MRYGKKVIKNMIKVFLAKFLQKTYPVKESHKKEFSRF